MAADVDTIGWFSLDNSLRARLRRWWRDLRRTKRNLPPPGYRVECMLGDDGFEVLGWHAFIGSRCVRQDGECFFNVPQDCVRACWAHYAKARGGAQPTHRAGAEVR